MKEQLEKKKKELQILVDKYNQTQKVLNSISQEIFKIQGAIELLEELNKEEVKGGE